MKYFVKVHFLRLSIFLNLRILILKKKQFCAFIVLISEDRLFSNMDAGTKQKIKNNHMHTKKNDDLCTDISLENYTQY